MRSKRRSVATRQKAAKRDKPDKRAIDRDGVVDFSTGEVARRLHISSRSACRLCFTGELASHRTPGGHIRVRLKDLEEYEQQRAGGDVSASAPRPEISRLSGEREQLQVLKLQLEERRVRRDLARIDEEDAKIQQARAEASAADLARNQAAIDQAQLQREQWEREDQRELEKQVEFERRQTWIDGWVQYALNLVSPELRSRFAADIQTSVQQALERLGPSSVSAIVQQVVIAAAHRAIEPWRRQQEIESVVQETLWQFLLAPSEWRLRAESEVRGAIARLAPNASLAELRAAGVAAFRAVDQEYRRQEEQQRQTAQEEQLRRRLATSKAFLVSYGVEQVGSHLRALHLRDEIFDEDLGRRVEIEKLVRTKLEQELTGSESYFDVQRMACQAVSEEVGA